VPGNFIGIYAVQWDNGDEEGCVAEELRAA
jgi:hypothetical protein